MMKRSLAIVVGLFALGSWLACGDEPCPKGYKEVDGFCVEKRLAPHCQFKGGSDVGQTCAATIDCNGCYVVCLEEVCADPPCDLTCVKQKPGGEVCARDAECRSQGCEAGLCIAE